MLTLEKLRPDHLAALYEICADSEPFGRILVPTLTHWLPSMANAEGFVMKDEDKIVGGITFSHLVPLVDICLHISVLPEYWGKWANRSVLRKIGEFCFKDLKLPRMSAIMPKGLSPAAELALVQAGFKIEGVRESALLYPDGYHDQVFYGMLRERCRWCPL